MKPHVEKQPDSSLPKKEEIEAYLDRLFFYAAGGEWIASLREWKKQDLIKKIETDTSRVMHLPVKKGKKDGSRHS